MKLFISFSSDISHSIATNLVKMLNSIFKEKFELFLSDNIHPSRRWNIELSRTLSECNIGVFCLTRDNWREPWINFEAGAISKDIQYGKPFIICFDFDPTEVKGPLQAFQLIKYTQEQLKYFVCEVNDCLGQNKKLSVDTLNDRFNANWTEFSSMVNNVLGEESNNIWDRRYDIPSSLVIIRHGLIHFDNNRKPYIPLSHFEFSTSRALVSGDYLFKRNSLGVGSQKNIDGIKQLIPEAEVYEETESKNLVVHFPGRDQNDQDIVPIFITERYVYIDDLLKPKKDKKIKFLNDENDIPRYQLFKDHISKDFQDFAGRRIYAPIHNLRLMIYFDNFLLPEINTIQPIIIDSKGRKIQSRSAFADRRIQNPQGDENSYLCIFESQNLPANSGMWAYWKWPFLFENEELVIPDQAFAKTDKNT